MTSPAALLPDGEPVSPRPRCVFCNHLLTHDEWIRRFNLCNSCCIKMDELNAHYGITRPPLANDGGILAAAIPVSAGPRLVFKEHIWAEMTNELKNIAMEFHNSRQLRERLLNCLYRYIERNQEWVDKHEPKLLAEIATLQSQITALREALTSIKNIVGNKKLKTSPYMGSRILEEPIEFMHVWQIAEQALKQES